MAVAVGHIKGIAYNALVRRWMGDLGSPVVGRDTVEAFRSHLSRCMNRRHGILTFYLEQVLRGHGCFGCTFTGWYAGNLPRRVMCGAHVDEVRHTMEGYLA